MQERASHATRGRCEITGIREPKGVAVAVGLLHLARGLLHFAADPGCAAAAVPRYMRPRRAMSVVSERGTSRDPAIIAL